MIRQVAEQEAQPDTSAQERIRRELAALLEQHREEIALAWQKLYKQRFPSAYAEQIPEERKLVETVAVLDAIRVQFLDPDSYYAWKANDLVMGSLARDWSDGFQAISRVIETMLLAKEAILPFVRGVYLSDPAALQEAVAQLELYLWRHAGRITTWLVEQATRQLEEQKQRTAMLLDMVQAASSTLALDEVLRRIARGIAAAAGVRHCALYLVDEDQRFLVPRIGVGDLATPALAKKPAWRERSLEVSQFPFVRQVLELQEPLACVDAQTDRRTQGEKMVCLYGARSVLAVPCLAKGRVEAVAFALTFDECRTFTDEQVDLAQGIALAVAPAIENARLHEQVRQLAIVEERERLAREMHDDLSQVLATVNWRAATIDRLLSGGQVAEARAGLRDLKEIAKQGYADVREAIFSLRSSASLESEFLPALEKYLKEYQAHNGLDVELVVDAGSSPHFPVDVRLQIIRIVQESLSNVCQHAGASRVGLFFRQDGEGVQLCVEDNGRGFDVTGVEGGERHRFGLSIMRERAASVGGELEIDSRPGQGTRVVLRLPLQSE